MPSSSWRRLWYLPAMILALSCLLIPPARSARAGFNPYYPYTVSVGTSPLAGGTILTDSRGMTLYVNSVDPPNASDCYSVCRTQWSPLQVPTSPTALGGIIEAIDRISLDPMVLGSIKAIHRHDGVYQIAYNGQPLYLFSSDNRPGDVNGQGLDGLWSVATPAPPPPPTPFGPPPPGVGEPAPAP